jgi:hypothetical protein
MGRRPPLPPARQAKLVSKPGRGRPPSRTLGSTLLPLTPKTFAAPLGPPSSLQVRGLARAGICKLCASHLPATCHLASLLSQKLRPMARLATGPLPGCQAARGQRRPAHLHGQRLKVRHRHQDALHDAVRHAGAHTQLDGLRPGCKGSRQALRPQGRTGPAGDGRRAATRCRCLSQAPQLIPQRPLADVAGAAASVRATRQQQGAQLHHRS